MDNQWVPTQLEHEIAEYISVLRRYYTTYLKTDLQEHRINNICVLLKAWNEFVRSKEGGNHILAIVSTSHFNDVNEFIVLLQNIAGTNTVSDEVFWIRGRLAAWNDFLLARQGESPVFKWGAILTSIGVLCYVVDLVSDVFTATQFGYSGHWWPCALSLGIMYLSVAISTANKWICGQIRCTGPLETIRYLGMLLMNWPDLRTCGALVHAEWKLFYCPMSNAHLVPQWHDNRVSVARLRYVEGVCEACPQSLLQLVLLLPELNGDISWTVSIRMMATVISLCTAGAALIHWEKVVKIYKHNALPLSELAVLHMWAVPVTVSRLLCLALLLSVHPYWGLACMALHLILSGTSLCRTWGVPRTFEDIVTAFVHSVLFLISPFHVTEPFPSYAVRHGVHFLGNSVFVTVWALSTPLECTQPVLYVACISIICVSFLTGLLGCKLHRKYFNL